MADDKRNEDNSFCRSSLAEGKLIVIAGKGNPPAPELNCLSHINFYTTLLIFREHLWMGFSRHSMHESCLPNTSSQIPATHVIAVSHENPNLRLKRFAFCEWKGWDMFLKWPQGTVTIMCMFSAVVLGRLTQENCEVVITALFHPALNKRDARKVI